MSLGSETLTTDFVFVHQWRKAAIAHSVVLLLGKHEKMAATSQDHSAESIEILQNVL